MSFNLSRSFQQLSATLASGDAQRDGIAAGQAPDRSQSRPPRVQPATISALAQLKALGPRLTPAQRQSIHLLENYDAISTGNGNVSVANGTRTIRDASRG